MSGYFAFTVSVSGEETTYHSALGLWYTGVVLNFSQGVISSPIIWSVWEGNTSKIYLYDEAGQLLEQDSVRSYSRDFLGMGSDGLSASYFAVFNPVQTTLHYGQTYTIVGDDGVFAHQFENVSYGGTSIYEKSERFTATFTYEPTSLPTALAFSPSHGTIDAALTSNIVLTFSESITRGTGNIQLRSGSVTGIVVETFNALTSDRITISGSSLTIDPTSDLSNNTFYYLTFDSGSIADLARNNLAWTGEYAFKTVDETIAPTVTTFSPTDGATSVAVASNITLTFSESIRRGEGDIQLRSGSATGTVVETFNAASSDRLTISGSSLTIDPTSELSNSTNYYLTFASDSPRSKG